MAECFSIRFAFAAIRVSKNGLYRGSGNREDGQRAELHNLEDQEMKDVHGHGPITLRLADEDPHAQAGSQQISDWWGREIIVKRPQKAQRKHECEATFIYEILGPPEFIKHLKKIGRERRFVCEHQISWEL